MAFWKKDRKAEKAGVEGMKVQRLAPGEETANAMRRAGALAQKARAEHLAKHPEDATAAERAALQLPTATEPTSAPHPPPPPSSAAPAVPGIPPQPAAPPHEPGSGFENPTPVTTGVLKFPDGEVAHIQSSIVGPACTDATLSQPMGTRFHWSTHVEGHAAAAMRARGATEAELTTNHPDGLCRACDFQAPAMLPEGSVLKVITADGDANRVQWLSSGGVTAHDPRQPAPPATGSRIRLAPGGCWGDGVQWFDSWDALWPALSQLVGRNPFFYDVSHEADAFQPFSLISTADGTAVVSFERSPGPFMMRAYGAHLHGLETLGASAWRTPIVEWTAPQDAPASFCIPLVSFLPPEHVDHTVREWIDPAQESTVFHEFAVFPWGP